MASNVLVPLVLVSASVLGSVVGAAAPAAAGPVTAEAAPAVAGPAADAAPDGATVDQVPIVLPTVDTTAATPRVELPEDVPLGAVVAEDVASDRVVTDPVLLDGHQTIGVTWPEQGAVTLDARLRTLTDGEWGEWVDLAVGDEVPDTGTADARAQQRSGTDPVWVGDAAEKVQLSFAVGDEGAPDGLTLTLVGSPLQQAPDAAAGPVPTSVPGGPLLAAEVDRAAGTVDVGAPVLAAAGDRRIIRRAEWGAPAQVCTPDVASTLTHVVLHHTAGSNDYSTVAQAMQQLRNDALYHLNGRGWCDLGYNFVVDKWGNIYEGRAGSAEQAVVGVHAGGFNTRSVGISMLGTYGTVSPSSAVQESVAWIAARRLGVYHRDPAGQVSIYTSGGENSSVPPGTTKVLPVIFGHRDVAYTSCPGNAGYATLPWVRARARELVRPTLVNPATTPTAGAMGTTFTVRAPTIGNVAWRLDVADARTGLVARSVIGYAQEAFGGVVAAWDGRTNAGTLVGPGSYTLTLSGHEGTASAPIRSYTSTVEVTGSQVAPPVAAVPLARDLRFVPVTPARLLDTRQTFGSLGPRSELDVTVTGRAGIPADARAVALNVTTVNSASTTFLRVYPAGQAVPAASALNSDQNRTTGSGIVVGVGGEGKVRLANNAGSTHVVVDVTGYFTDAPGKGMPYEQLATGARVLDTRTEGGRMSDGGRRTVQVAGRQGIPSTATAVAVNVTSVMPAAPGNISAFPSGGAVPGTASVNHLPGHDVSNRTIVPLSADGRLDIVLAGGSADVVLDVVGWFGPEGRLTFTPVAPVRAFDTRTGTGGALVQGQTRPFDLTALAGVPADARVVAVALAATQQSAYATFVTLWRDGVPRPTTSDLNTGRGRDQVNLSFATVAGGKVQVYNNAGATHVVADVFGYFR